MPSSIIRLTTYRPPPWQLPIVVTITHCTAVAKYKNRAYWQLHATICLKIISAHVQKILAAAAGKYKSFLVKVRN